jgi:hypothetical protein
MSARRQRRAAEVAGKGIAGQGGGWLRDDATYVRRTAA